MRAVLLVVLVRAALPLALEPREAEEDSDVQEPLRGVRRCAPPMRCPPPCEWPPSVCDPRVDGRAAGRTAVIITAWGRSGTTFLGEILQRNRRFLYLYEPLRARFRAHLGQAIVRNGEESAAFLSRVLDCQISLRDRVLLSKDKAALARGGLCNLARSAVTPACACKHMAVKTIRINGQLDLLIGALNGSAAGGASGAAAASSATVDGLFEGARSAGADATPTLSAAPHASSVHVVHLVRDPRAILASWQQLPGFAEFKQRSSGRAAHDVAATLCRLGLKDRDAGLRAEAQYARARAGSAGAARAIRYSLLRYEDLALSPIATARQLYAWLRLPLPARLLRWINESTHASSARRYAVRANAAHGLDAEHDPHATVRDAARIVGKWRQTLSPLHIVAATRACDHFLRELGYETDLALLVPEAYRELKFPFKPNALDTRRAPR
ncbi:hypothetical protein KFE25_001073 [Diacronema lutheri]|uniref:Protein-tyrosine sulfotransferase n=1 Tax=Diacronema lutheri TaxID=2081491 RepID=A0A8J6C5X7_DIALT|nr:hypothetical protein KFE25_001073 [Diacronema lutheri]|mmetsp:Transcript_1642/g.5393  ORF Transcript_1642/g.5393 Transcript_1642/m.5393 type:complete len:441 (-) Transcript_1642:81-1403(-)